MQDNKTMKKITANIVAIVMLLVGLCITTYALSVEVLVVKDNYFNTGTISINLNDGKPIIEEGEYLFEPGMTVQKEFFLENTGTWEIYYKFYFDNIIGDLANYIEVEILDGTKSLYKGTMAELSKDEVLVADDTLGILEKKVFKISFHMPENIGNVAKNLTLSFDLRADAVQTKNNPDKLFE